MNPQLSIVACVFPELSAVILLLACTNVTTPMVRIWHWWHLALATVPEAAELTPDNECSTHAFDMSQQAWPANCQPLTGCEISLSMPKTQQAKRLLMLTGPHVALKSLSSLTAGCPDRSHSGGGWRGSAPHQQVLHHSLSRQVLGLLRFGLHAVHGPGEQHHPLPCSEPKP